jgi:ATP-binding cassette subfamily B protein
MFKSLKPFKVIYQLDSMDCGPACLGMLCNHYGKNISLTTIRDRTQIGKEGVNMLGLSEAAEDFGFRALAVQISCEQLVNEVSLPCILHWSQVHFVVLTKVKKKSLFYRKERFVIADPISGLVTLDLDTFQKHWVSNSIDNEPVGVALLVEPTKTFYEKGKEDTASTVLAFRSIFNSLLTYKKRLLQLILSLGVASLVQMLLPFLTKSIVDTGIKTKDISFIYLVLYAQAALFFGKITMDIIRNRALLYIGTCFNISVLSNFLSKLMKLPIGFFDSKQTGDIMQRIDDHKRIESFLTGSSLNVLFSLITLLVFSVVLACYNGMVFFVFVLAGLVYILWVVFFLKKRKQLDYKQFGVAAHEQSTVIQMIQGMQEIKLQGCEKQIQRNWDRIQAKLFKLKIKGLNIEQWQQSGALVINEGKNMLITFFCAKAVIEEQLTLGTMLAIQYIIGQLNSPLEQMIDFVRNWQNAKISMERLNEIHHMEEEEPVHLNLLKELPASLSKKLAGGKLVTMHPAMFPTGSERNVPADKTHEPSYPVIAFNKVSFTYTGAGNEPVLNEISFSIPPGKTTAIVGMSGSGKTTLLKLLLRFYVPQQGDIKFGNTQLNKISHKVWRNRCGVVMQDSFIFSASIADNIAVGVEKINKEKLTYAVKLANIEGFIEDLPLGFNTKIGPDGHGISQGQRQRILIARAVYKNPDLILLDEATNSLDANNESIIIENLQQFFKGRTVVVVAHRLSTVKHADQIIMLERGRIAEKGTHQELVNLKGYYYTLVKNQLDLDE